MGDILLVDDERSIRITFKVFLENEGHRVETAEDARSALALFEQRPADLVLTDIILPKMSGIDLLKAIKARSPEALVIVMTGEPTLETAAECLRLGALDYLRKPVGKEGILKAVRNALGVKSLRDEKNRLEKENLEYTTRLEKLVEERTRALTESEAALRRRADELTILNSLAQALGKSPTLEDAIQAGMKEIAQASGSDLCLVLLKEGDALVLKGYLMKNPEGTWEPADAHRVGECLCGLAALEKRPVYARDVRSDPRCTMRECIRAGLTAFAALPLESDYDTLGVLGLASYRPSDFEVNGPFLEALANELAIGLKKNLLFAQLKTHAMELQDSLEQLKAAERERIDLINQLQQAQKMEAIGALAGGIAHDFNNILSAILGFTELGLDNIPQDSTVHGYLENVLTAAIRARDLVQQILNFSRQYETALNPIQVNTIAREAVKMLRASLPSTIEIRQDIQSRLLVLADPTNIHQILLNLGTNAAHAMRESGGTLEIRLDDVQPGPEFLVTHPGLGSGPHIRLVVSDTGHGIPENVQGLIFESFFTTKKPGEGTGLGLSVVRGIVQRLRGHITVTSASGQGASFEIHLPAVEPEDIVALFREEYVPLGAERILLVDDELTLVDVNTLVLESLGYRVTGVGGALEALKIFQTDPDAFDLVITDMTMPQMTGDVLTKALLEIRPNLPVILLTGFSTDIDEGSAAGLGVQALLHKPVLRKKLAETIRKALDSRRRSTATNQTNRKINANQ
ncbi:MAG: response regulator [Pseudomonadota bacterium]